MVYHDIHMKPVNNFTNTDVTKMTYRFEQENSTNHLCKVYLSPQILLCHRLASTCTPAAHHHQYHMVTLLSQYVFFQANTMWGPPHEIVSWFPHNSGPSYWTVPMNTSTVILPVEHSNSKR